MMSKLINISELSKILNFVDSKTKKPQNHIVRFWEKKFKEIRPQKINKRRYYSTKQVEIDKIFTKKQRYDYYRSQRFAEAKYE